MAKKQIKKKATKEQPPSPQTAMAVIPISEIVKPELYRGKYNLAPTRLNEIQLKAIVEPVPQKYIKKRPGKGGGQWDFVPAWWFKKRLNFIFGFDGWDTVIEGERIDGDFITVKGKLVIKDPKTGKEMVSKSDYGGATIKFKKDMAHKPENYLDLANDFKAAQSDLIKRCCVQLGFAMNVYGVGESKSEGQTVMEPPANPSQPQAPKPGQVAGPEGKPVYLCAEGGEIIPEQVYDYSMRMFKKPLCREHQPKKK